MKPGSGEDAAACFDLGQSPLCSRAPSPRRRRRNIRTGRSISSCRRPQAAPPIPLARILAAPLTQEIGQQIIVDDRPGGALTVGLDLTAKAAPDGYTLCMGPIGALAISPHLVKNLPYDIARDFQPIALVTRGQLLLAVSPTTPFQSGQGADRLCQAESGQAFQRVVEQWLARPCRRRAVQVHDRHRHRARAL